MKVLVTGGAGFIGANLVRALAADGDTVRVLDDFSTGRQANLDGVAGDVEVIEGDVRDPLAVRKAVAGVEVVHHLAALPSVARSVADPRASHEVNVDGTLTVLLEARDAQVRRLVYASSSSVYGNTPTLPKHEDMPVSPRSPYAAAKLAGEAYCRAFAGVYPLEAVCLRFFNVFGPRQDPASQYAAVVPRFVTRMLAGQPAEVTGDGRQTRDFTYVANAVSACRLAAATGPEAVPGDRVGGGREGERRQHHVARQAAGPQHQHQPGGAGGDGDAVPHAQVLGRPRLQLADGGPVGEHAAGQNRLGGPGDGVRVGQGRPGQRQAVREQRLPAEGGREIVH